MIQLNDLWDLLESFLELSDLFEMVTKFDDRRRSEHPVFTDDEFTVFERVDVGFDEQEVGAALDGQETGSGDVDAAGVLEVFDGSSCGGFELRYPGMLYQYMLFRNGLKRKAVPGRQKHPPPSLWG